MQLPLVPAGQAAVANMAQGSCLLSTEDGRVGVSASTSLWVLVCKETGHNW